MAAFVTAVLALIPVLVTGGIHVDGLLDTSDALSSWQERCEKTGDSEGFPCRSVRGDHSSVFTSLHGMGLTVRCNC
ncbi:MAG: adenosylcobinamide-GDP ribazoletransferase [Blautia wexlerae]